MDETVIFGVSSYPEPLHTVRNWHSKSAIVQANPDAPIWTTAELVELQGSVIRITAEQGVVAAR